MFVLKNKKILLLFLLILFLVMIVPYSFNKYREKIYIGKIALVLNTDYKIDKNVFSNDKGDIKSPKYISIGEIAYIRSIYKNYAYVDLLRPMQVYNDDNSGYMHLNNLKIDYSIEEISAISEYCHLKNKETKVYNEPNGAEVLKVYDPYLIITGKKDNWVKVGLKGCGEQYWLHPEDIDYDFSLFASEMENFKPDIN